MTKTTLREKEIRAAITAKCNDEGKALHAKQSSKENQRATTKDTPNTDGISAGDI